MEKALQLAIDFRPGKETKFGTTSRKFKRDLVEFFKDTAQDWTVLEIGRLHGDTTFVLSRLFARVISVDLYHATMPQFPGGNIMYLSLDVYSVPWSWFTNGNNIAVVVIDAEHSYEAVSSDIWNALRYCGNTLRWIVLDDWGLPSEYDGEGFGVRRAAKEFEALGYISCAAAIGEQATNGESAGVIPSVLEASEGRICKVLRHLPQTYPDEVLASWKNADSGKDLNDKPTGMQAKWGPAVILGKSTWWVFRIPYDSQQNNVFADRRELGEAVRGELGGSFRDAQLHDRLEISAVDAGGTGRVHSGRHSDGFYRPQPHENGHMASLILRFGVPDFSSTLHRPRPQLELAFKDHKQACWMRCVMQPGRFEPDDAEPYQECDSRFVFLGMNHRSLADSMYRIFLDHGSVW
eukprot:gnl/TRDRNA2_/TRDRNA2_160996_c0_seq2.p1 gnl/TRDRNA2_/TRDRNA2_160996_c0~~gnl/TRDRNA2_/TRDRNA2_160996_c0_seq2.p1  ORF type:complete len:473 (+),score=57.39 gnl/TRDRNA2_/TRDRNA2_160996_c0_seq2:200-1420(+)